MTLFHLFRSLRALLDHLEPVIWLACFGVSFATGGDPAWTMGALILCVLSHNRLERLRWQDRVLDVMEKQARADELEARLEAIKLRAGIR